MLPTTYAYRIGGITDPEFAGDTLDLGPTHPASAGMLDLAISASEGRITSVDPSPGALHRGAEPILTARDYRQALSLANRHDWQAPFFGEWALARLVEDALGVEVPVRARWVRAVLAEHTRTASHLAHLSFVGHRLRDAALDTTGVREELRERTAELTGNRLHPMAVRLGGVACDPTPVWADAERATLARASELAARLGAALGGGLGAGVAPVTRAQVDAHGLAGPVARASRFRHRHHVASDVAGITRALGLDGLVLPPDRLSARTEGTGLLGLRIDDIQQLELLSKVGADFAVVVADVSGHLRAFGGTLALTAMPVYLAAGGGLGPGSRPAGLQGIATGRWRRA